MNIEELAAGAGLSRRAVRFYVQRGLLQPPHGLGRGRHYDQKHVEELQQIRELQEAGHSLDAIKKIQRGEAVAAAEPATHGRGKPRRRATLTAGLWTRLVITDGVELHLDAAKLNPDVKHLLVIQKTIRKLLG